MEPHENELAAIRRNIEGLSARQDEMADNIATLQSSAQNVREQLTALTQAPTLHARRHRSARH
jgi:prefoldin subunit 5